MRPAYFTICCSNYLPRAMVLFESLARHGAGENLHLVLADDPAVRPAVELLPGVTLMGLEDLGIPDVMHLAFYYNITEFNTALKPHAFLKLFEAGNDAVVYLDPDIRFYSSVAPLEAHLDEGDILLTPHIAKPYDCDGVFPTVRDCLHAGQFNLGFAAMRPTPQTLAFTRWWADRLMEHCLQEPGYYYFVDQLWASHAPSFVDKVKVLRHSRYNMAYWNFFQRELALEDGVYHTEDGPLCFFHFSGYQFENPNVFSRYSPKNSPVPQDSPLGKLLAGYRSEAAEMARRYPYEGLPYCFGRYRDGEPVTDRDRRAFLALSRRERSAIDDPFSPGNRQRLRAPKADAERPGQCAPAAAPSASPSLSPSASADPERKGRTGDAA